MESDTWHARLLFIGQRYHLCRKAGEAESNCNYGKTGFLAPLKHMMGQLMCNAAAVILRKLGPLCAAPSKPVASPDLYKPEEDIHIGPSHAVTATKLESVAMSVMHLCILSKLGSNILEASGF